jgi:predicted  nucleic acid-binding Zn-ribbon protein
VEGQLQLLVRLQDLESGLQRLDEAVIAKSQEIEALTRTRDEMRDTIIKHRREQQENLDKQRRRLESEVTEEQYKLQKAQRQLREVKTNKEYSAKLVEIERVKQKISACEDSISP